MRSLVVAVVLLVAAGAYLLFGRSGSERAPAPVQTPPPAAGELQGPQPAAAVLPERRPAPAVAAKPGGGYIEYPDGTFLPPLNGVTVSVKPIFHPRLSPFAKVTHVERDRNGREWYVHENGVRSTVFVNRAGIAVYEVEKPTEPLPMLPDEVPDPPPSTGGERK